MSRGSTGSKDFPLVIRSERRGAGGCGAGGGQRRWRNNKNKFAYDSHMRESYDAPPPHHRNSGARSTPCVEAEYRMIRRSGCLEPVFPQHLSAYFPVIWPRTGGRRPSAARFHSRTTTLMVG